MTVPRKGKVNLMQRNTKYCIEMSKSNKKVSLNYSVETWNIIEVKEENDQDVPAQESLSPERH